MNKYHYTYRITNTKENKHYYGVRSSKVEPKLDLGIKYFSSSSDKEFINEQKINNSIFKYKVIKIFETREEAINLEIKLHSKFDVGRNKSFYNRSKQTSNKFDTSGVKISHAISRNEKIKNTLTGKKHTIDRINKMKKTLQLKYQSGFEPHNKGKSTSLEIREKISMNHARLSGEENHMTKTIKIFSDSNELKFISTGCFLKFCKENNLPCNQFNISYKNNGLPIYKSNKGKNYAIENGFGEYIGWYALVELK